MKSTKSELYSINFNVKSLKIFFFLKLALKNALRYFPKSLHKLLAKEFEDELNQYGHIYMYRFLPDIRMKYYKFNNNKKWLNNLLIIIRAYPIDQYPFKTVKAGCIMLMIMNNLDPDVAQFPEELIT